MTFSLMFLSRILDNLYNRLKSDLFNKNEISGRTKFLTFRFHMFSIEHTV
jgi:hypothetical protein